MANLLLTFQNFRYYDNKDWCETNFLCTVKFADPENHMFGAIIGDLSLIQAKL